MQFPGPVRAAVGLLATAANEARHLPDRAIELPMLAISTALQVSMRAQQRYAQLAARGDEVLNRRRTTDEPPPWATFDEPVPDGARGTSELLDDLLAADDASPGPRKPAKKAPRKAPAKKATSTADKSKSVHRPRNGPPSAFDSVDPS